MAIVLITYLLLIKQIFYGWIFGKSQTPDFQEEFFWAPLKCAYAICSTWQTIIQDESIRTYIKRHKRTHAHTQSHTHTKKACIKNSLGKQKCPYPHVHYLRDSAWISIMIGTAITVTAKDKQMHYVIIIYIPSAHNVSCLVHSFFF